LSDAGLEVHLISQHPLLENPSSRVETHLLPFRGGLGYFTMVPAVRKLLQKIQPDLVNAHYASGYGATARLANYHPWILSLWGSDVYTFPYTSWLHKRFVVSNLLAADEVISTSHCMAAQTRRLSRKIDKINVVPFGVELDSFLKIPESGSRDQESNRITIGTVKSMLPVYGIDLLLKAFAIAYRELVAMDSDWADRLYLRLVGDGESIDEYRQLGKDLKIDQQTEFVGRVPHADVPKQLGRLDVFVALSRSESFGVAVIEANAANLPVIVSDAEGLREVVVEDQTGLVVPGENPQAAAEAIIRLVRDPVLRSRLGSQGRDHVIANYLWSSCVERMIQVYQNTIDAS